MADVTTTRPEKTPAARSRTGRRAGDSGTRDRILEAARGRFAEHGFAGTTIRAVAADAGVDPALVHHFYGSKDDLFAAAVALPIDPNLLPAVVAGDPAGVGERFVRFYLGLWEDPTIGPTLLAVFRSAVSHDRAAALLREFVSARLLQRARPVTLDLGFSTYCGHDSTLLFTRSRLRRPGRITPLTGRDLPPRRDPVDAIERPST